MSGGREWAMTLEVECANLSCPARDSATVAGRSAHDATEGAKKVLRYRGWTIGRLEDHCPKHSQPIPACDICGDPTPVPYGHDKRSRHISGVAWCCDPCYRIKFDASLRDHFGVELQRRRPA